MDYEWQKFNNRYSDDDDDEQDMFDSENTATVECRYDEIQKFATFLIIAAQASMWYHKMLGVPLPQTLVTNPCDNEHYNWSQRFNRKFNLGDDL